MDALISEVLRQARGIAEDVQRRIGVRMRTATVTSADPLRIRYDGEDDASVVTPRTVVQPRVGDRAVVAKTRGQATILGVLGGQVGPWHPVTVLPGFNAQPGFEPRVRMEYGRVRFHGGLDGGSLDPGSSQHVMQIPETFRPTSWGYGLVVSSNADAIGMTVVESSGRVSLRTSERSGSYYLWTDFYYDL